MDRCVAYYMRCSNQLLLPSDATSRLKSAALLDLSYGSLNPCFQTGMAQILTFLIAMQTKARKEVGLILVNLGRAACYFAVYRTSVTEQLATAHPEASI